jgi:hypothetical protein
MCNNCHNNDFIAKNKQEEKWTPTSSSMPNSGKKVDWMDSQGNIVMGGSVSGKLWFLPENGMYVYYTPQFWRYSSSR